MFTTIQIYFLWNKCLDVRDSGPCSVGSIFVLLGPNPITEQYYNNILFIIPSGGVILMQESGIGDISDFWDTISDSNKTVSFQVTGKITYLLQIMIVLVFYNRQNLQGNKKKRKICLCYSSGDARHAKLTLNFGLKIQLENNTIIIENNFTSHKFSQFL